MEAPVGARSQTAEAAAPRKAPPAPKATESPKMPASRSDQNRAATAGRMSRATTSNSPTDWRPSTVTSTPRPSSAASSPATGQPRAPCMLFVETEEAERAEQRQQQAERQKRGQGQPEGFRSGKRRRLAQDETFEAALAARRQGLHPGEQHDADGVEDTERNRDGGVGSEAGAARQRLGGRHAENAGQRRSGQQHRQGAPLGPQRARGDEGQHDARQGRMADRIGRHRPRAQQEESPDAAGRGSQRRGARHDHAGIVAGPEGQRLQQAVPGAGHHAASARGPQARGVVGAPESRLAEDFRGGPLAMATAFSTVTWSK